MAAIDQAFVAKLKSGTNSAVANRVFPDAIPENVAKPAISWFNKDEAMIARTIGDAGGLAKAIFQVDCWADNALTGKASTKTMKEAVRSTFDSSTARGTWTYTGGDFFVQHCRVEENHDDFAPPAFSSDSGEYAVSLNVVVIFTETVPA